MTKNGLRHLMTKNGLVQLEAELLAIAAEIPPETLEEAVYRWAYDQYLLPMIDLLQHIDKANPDPAQITELLLLIRGLGNEAIKNPDASNREVNQSRQLIARIEQLITTH